MISKTREIRKKCDFIHTYQGHYMLIKLGSTPEFSTRQAMYIYNATLGRVCATTVAIETQ